MHFSKMHFSKMHFSKMHFLKMHFSKNLQNVVKFQKCQLENLVDFEKCCQTHIFLQKSELIQMKTSNILPKFCQPTLSDVSADGPEAEECSTDPRPLGPTGGGQRRGQRHPDLRGVGPRAKGRIAAPPSSFSAAHFSGAARQSVASAKEDVAFARLTVNVGSLDIHELH